MIHEWRVITLHPSYHLQTGRSNRMFRVATHVMTQVPTPSQLVHCMGFLIAVSILSRDVTSRRTVVVCSFRGCECRCRRRALPYLPNWTGARASSLPVGPFEAHHPATHITANNGTPPTFQSTSRHGVYRAETRLSKRDMMMRERDDKNNQKTSVSLRMQPYQFAV